MHKGRAPGTKKVVKETTGRAPTCLAPTPGPSGAGPDLPRWTSPVPSGPQLPQWETGPGPVSMEQALRWLQGGEARAPPCPIAGGLPPSSHSGIRPCLPGHLASASLPTPPAAPVFSAQRSISDSSCAGARVTCEPGGASLGSRGQENTQALRRRPSTPRRYWLSRAPLASPAS